MILRGKWEKIFSRRDAEVQRTDKLFKVVFSASSASLREKKIFSRCDAKDAEGNTQQIYQQ
jgi:hypothetical protein